MSPNIVYGLIDPVTRLIRYVGMSSRGMERPLRHKYKSNKDQTYCARWVRGLLDAGLCFEITVLEYCATRPELADAEIWWIAYGRASGWPLTNLTDGGDGGLLGYVPSELTRARISAGRTGILHTDEAKARMSRAQTGKVLSDEHVANIGLAMARRAGVPRPVYVGEKISRSKRGVPFTPEHKKALSDAKLGSSLTPGHKQSISQAKRGVPLTPKHRRAISDVAKRRAPQRRRDNGTYA